ncbi:hypothetical protein NMY22_g8901 [Coprinellus aureogranulatus]|nr:hypothetical protein NMY22_g8901 [Coprinellus aureogranulatus]
MPRFLFVMSICDNLDLARFSCGVRSKRYTAMRPGLPSVDHSGMECLALPSEATSAAKQTLSLTPINAVPAPKTRAVFYLKLAARTLGYPAPSYNGCLQHFWIPLTVQRAKAPKGKAWDCAILGTSARRTSSRGGTQPFVFNYQVARWPDRPFSLSPTSATSTISGACLSR